MKWLSLLASIIFALRKFIVSDQSVVNTNGAVGVAPGAASGNGSLLSQVAKSFEGGAAVLADVKEDIADIKAGQIPTDIVKQIQDVEAFAATVLTLGATLSADFGVSPAALKNAIPEVIALAKKIL
ncbi:hypothetical protein EGJ48_03510 [Pantoea dispersa]|uniref:hypothetical protein n=1 Tax=Pantoea dispersa TaxID=59814 RepID=UPI000F661A35|nr:hypothetical protein [Pantoea dispersa]RRW77625.1 hypothetical protein EGJ48_03510 [Pantoea dispersa]